MIRFKSSFCTSQVIGCEDYSLNDLQCVKSDIKPYCGLLSNFSFCSVHCSSVVAFLRSFLCIIRLHNCAIFSNIQVRRMMKALRINKNTREFLVRGEYNGHHWRGNRIAVSWRMCLNLLCFDRFLLTSVMHSFRNASVNDRFCSCLEAFTLVQY